MRTIHTPWQPAALCIVLFVTIFALILAACGPRSSGTGSGLQPSPIPTSGTVAGYGYDTAPGCPSDVVVSPAPPAADVIVQPKQAATPITAHQGEVIEIQVPFGVTWEGPTTSPGPLQLQSPYGYAWKPDSACIWRFLAQRTGTVELLFSGMAICKKDLHCVPSVTEVSFTIKVI
jgi:hypothetical protein